MALEGGDICLLRFGWTAWYYEQPRAERAQLAEIDLFPCSGLAAEECTAGWLWDSGIAAVCADCPALEAMPIDESSEEGFLHFRLIPPLGIAIGEMDALAEDLRGGRRLGRSLQAGGSGSAANALALK
jgi:hypothetical protein